MIRVLQDTVVVLFALMISACDPPVQEQKERGDDPVSEQFIRANQYMQQRHQDHIAAFLERVGWKAEVTPSGLWIVVEQPGEGKRIGENNRVTYAFESTLLDGTPCYSASIQNPKEITIGKGGVESGVEQGLQKLSEGAVALFLIPPHLAHGNFGDREKIPGNSVLIYRVQVLKVE
ncbi:MAG: FKBP-type peptidyl-prolyl cis-trans isomerase [Bacteroidales bacterium]|nr:FKBP-type peptidyl-prolyl cis-trans isomerase [Bacteroidales bacterium]